MEVRFFFKPNFNAALVFVKESYSSSKLGSSLTQEDPLCYLPGRALIRVEPGGPRHSYESLSRVGLCSPQTCLLLSLDIGEIGGRTISFHCRRRLDRPLSSIFFPSHYCAVIAVASIAATAADSKVKPRQRL